MIWGVDAQVFGAWAQFGGAVATFAAVVVALWVAIRDGRHRERDHQEELAGQARTIVVGVQRTGHAPPADGFQVVVDNQSSAPIIDLTVLWISVLFDDAEFTQPPECQIGGVDPPVHVRPVLSAADSYRSPPILFYFNTGDAVVAAPKDRGLLHAVVACEFTDARGIRWRREGGKQPQRVRDR